jgi:hypothetical protein
MEPDTVPSKGRAKLAASAKVPPHCSAASWKEKLAAAAKVPPASDRSNAQVRSSPLKAARELKAADELEAVEERLKIAEESLHADYQHASTHTRGMVLESLGSAHTRRMVQKSLDKLKSKP